MLRIIAGRSGSGKSEMIHREICSRAGKDEIVLIVPEQSSFQCEKRMLDDLGAKKAATVNVKSFKRLYETVCELYGGADGRHIDEGVRTVLMSVAAESVSDRLVMYGSRCKRSDFAELMSQAVNEFKMCAISPAQLQAAAEKTENERLRMKLSESAAIYEAYNSLLSGTYIDPDDDLTRLEEILMEHHFFEGKVVYIDSFNGFSGQEQKIIRLILEQADEVVAALCCDESTSESLDESVFREPDITLRKLVSMAEECGVEIKNICRLKGNPRYKSPSIAAIEESVFRFDGDPYYTDDDAVQIYEADDEYDEVRQAARSVCALVRDCGYAYRDITIIFRDPETYMNIIASEFPKYDIPFFMSRSQPLEEKALIRMIISAFEIIHSSFNTENIMTFLKTDMTSLSAEQVCRLENYAYLWDIRGIRWKSPFTMNPDGNVDVLDEKELAYIEGLRSKVIEPLTVFADKLAIAENGADISKALYELLCMEGTAQKLKNLAKSFSSPDELHHKETEARIWDMTMGILDKMYSVLHNIRLDSRRYLELLRLMIRKNPISDIPQTLDHVVIGTAGNLRTLSQRAVFVMGALEGVFPAIPTSAGLFSDSERNSLLGMELPLYDSTFGMALKEKFNAYSALALPSERLFISRYLTNLKGVHCEESVIIKEVRAILPEVKIRRRYELTPEELFCTDAQSFEECAVRWRENSPVSASLKKHFSESAEYSERLSAIDRLVNDEPYHISSRERTRKLFGDKMTLSASQVESYYQCPFYYFCKYGMKAYPRKKADMNSATFGSAVHFILENILSKESMEDLQQSDKSMRLKVIRKYIDAYIETIGGKTDRTNRFLVQFDLIEKNMLVLLGHLIEEFRVCSFRPTDFELEIGNDDQVPEYELTLPEGETINIVGKVDRVDTFINGDSKYIRIIDYKTGTKSFQLSDVLYGLNLQMLLYLSIIEKNGGQHFSDTDKYRLTPAGILYMPATPESKIGKYDSKEIHESVLKDQKNSFRMNGLLINDPEILAAMESDGKGMFIPAKLDENGNPVKSDKYLASLEAYGRIFRFVDKKLLEMAESLYKGDVKREPIKSKSSDACKYCDYKTVCGFEKGKSFRKKTKIDHAAAIEAITASEKEESNNE